MGVQSDITLPTQVTATYHKIDSISEIKWHEDGTGEIELAVSQYLSYEARLAGAVPVNKTFKTIKITKDLVDILRFAIYRAILPLAPEFSEAASVQDGELGNMLCLLKYLNDAEMSSMIFALTDILALKGVDPETYRPWYDSLKEEVFADLMGE